MFRGTSFHTIDPKGRVIVPARFRDLLKNGDQKGAMVSKLDRSLVVYPYDTWYQIESRILAMAETSDTMRRFRRVFIGGASDCNCDRQDRILIPPILRDYAKLDKEIVLVGVLNHFEIWSRDNWDIENQVMEEDLQNEEVRTEIAKLGL